MKNIQKFEQFINELFTFGDKENLDGKNVLLIGSKVWLSDDYDFEEFKTEIANELGIDEDEFDIHNLLGDEKYPQMIFGHIDEPYLVISNNGNFRHSRVSPDLKKLVRDLGLDSVKIDFTTNYNTGDMASVEEDPTDNYNDLKKEHFYHGTCLEHIDGILNTGIVPNKISGSKSNFDSVKHYDKTFVTLNIEKAHFHAMTAARTKESFPLILIHRIPDPARLDLDYDIAIQYYSDEDLERLGYNEIEHSHQRGGDLGHINLGKKLGVFSYLGRIPASFIESVKFDEQAYKALIEDREFGNGFDLDSDVINPDINEWSEVRASEFKSYLSSLEEEVMDMYSHDEDEEDEYYDDEDNDNYDEDDEDDEDKN